VILCALIVYFTEENFAKYVDPALSILSAVLRLILSYPHSKYILLVNNSVLQLLSISQTMWLLSSFLVTHNEEYLFK
jgi:hypothetical protein